jgi:hypothetical protein
MPTRRPTQTWFVDDNPQKRKKSSSTSTNKAGCVLSWKEHTRYTQDDDGGKGPNYAHTNLLFTQGFWQAGVVKCDFVRQHTGAV